MDGSCFSSSIFSTNNWGFGLIPITTTLPLKSDGNAAAYANALISIGQHPPPLENNNNNDNKNDNDEKSDIVTQNILLLQQSQPPN